MKIPDDFPRDDGPASLAGAHPKLSVRRNDVTGTYYAGPNDDEVEQRYEFCEDIAHQLVSKCIKDRDTKYIAYTELDILEKLLKKLLVSNWGTEAEMRWIIRRTASSLSWPVPKTALEKNP